MVVLGHIAIEGVEIGSHGFFWDGLVLQRVRFALVWSFVQRRWIRNLEQRSIMDREKR